MAQSFILVLLIPREVVGTRTVLKFSFDWEALTQGRTLLRDIFAAAGFTRKKFDVAIGDASWAESYHLEVRVQSPLRAGRLTLPPAEPDGDIVVDSPRGAIAHVAARFPYGPPVTPKANLEVSSPVERAPSLLW